MLCVRHACGWQRRQSDSSSAYDVVFRLVLSALACFTFSSSAGSTKIRWRSQYLPTLVSFFGTSYTARHLELDWQ